MHLSAERARDLGRLRLYVCVSDGERVDPRNRSFIRTIATVVRGERGVNRRSPPPRLALHHHVYCGQKLLQWVIDVVSSPSTSLS